MSDPILQYLQSIDDRTARMENRINETLDKHQLKIDEHSEKFAEQRGVMLGGGAVITLISGCVAWIVDHFSRNG